MKALTRIAANCLLAVLLAVCGHAPPALAQSPACDDGLKTAFRPGSDTSVVAVRLVKKGEELMAPDAPRPVTAAADLCLVKLLVGPGVTAEKDPTARSYSEGIGIEVWLPAHANWNERIRNYGGGGWVGGGLRYADKIGSKVPAVVNANMGYASEPRMPDSRGTRTARSRFSRTARSTPRRGNANQTPTREQDQFFTALVDWVEKNVAPGDIMLTSRDSRVSYPVCVYPLRTTWNGSGPATQATSYACR